MPIKPGPDLLAGPFAKRTSLGPKIAAAPETKLPPPKAPSGVRVEDRIGIQAPAEIVWEIVRDLSRWHEWNPTYPQAEGEIRMGAVLAVTLVLPGQDPQALAPKVLEWVPNEQLHWELRLLGGLIRTLRYIEIETLANRSCVVDNGEIFGGLMGPSLGKRMGRTVQRGFKAMNEALKLRAEAEWAKQQAG